MEAIDIETDTISKIYIYISAKNTGILSNSKSGR